MNRVIWKFLRRMSLARRYPRENQRKRERNIFLGNTLHDQFDRNTQDVKDEAVFGIWQIRCDSKHATESLINAAQ